MKKLTYALIAATLFVVLTIVFSPLSNGTSNNPCYCNIHPGYTQYLNILPSDSNTQIPSSLSVNQTATISVTFQNDVPNYSRYTTISGVYVSLTSAFGHFSGGNSIFFGDLAPGTQTVSWQISGISDGYDYFQIKLTGTNTHRGVTFQDNYYPLVTVGQPSGPVPTVPATPTPPPTPFPNPGSSGVIITSRPTTNPTGQPTATSNPTNQPTQLQIQLLSPTQNEIWLPQTNHTINWTATGGKEPLNVTLEYSFSGHEGTWLTIATNLSANGSLDWVTLKENENFYIQASVKDASNPTQTAFVTAYVLFQAEIIGNPLLPITAAIIITIIVLVLIVLVKKRKTGKTKN